MPSRSVITSAIRVYLGKNISVWGMKAIRFLLPEIASCQTVEQEAHSALSLPWCEHQGGQGCWMLFWKSKEGPPIGDTNLSQAENKNTLFIIYAYY